MLALERWEKGRFKPLAMLAHVVATSAEACYQFVIASQKKSLLSCDREGRISLDDWLRLYRQPARVEAMGLHFLDPAADLDLAGQAIHVWPQVKTVVQHGLEAMAREALLGQTTPEDVEYARRYMEHFYRLVHLPQLKRMLTEVEEPPPDFRRWFSRPEFVFLLAVAIPCWLEFHETPWALFLRARNGDFDALEKLLRLDPDVDKETTLIHHAFRLRKQRPEQHQALLVAAEQGRTAKISLRQIKYQLGGLLMKWSHDCDRIGVHYATRRGLVLATSAAPGGFFPDSGSKAGSRGPFDAHLGA